MNLVLVYFVYGLSFFILGTLLAFQARTPLRLHPLNYLWLVASFGILHGLAEWADMFNILQMQVTGERSTILSFAALLLTAVSFTFLFEWGLGLLHLEGNLYYWLMSVPVVLLVLWGLITIPLAAPLGGIGSIEWINFSQAVVRYGIGFPGALVTAFALWEAARHLWASQGRAGIYLTGAAIAFALYSIFAGLIVPPTFFFPATIINTDTFLAVFGLPVQIFRAACAVVVAFCLAEAFIVEAGRVQAEFLEQIRQEENLLSVIIRTLPVGVVYVQSEGGRIIANDVARQLLGTQSGEPVTMPSPEFVAFRPSGERYRREELPLTRALQKGESSYAEEVDIRLRDGNVTNLLFNSTPVLDSEGQISGAVAAFVDITRLRELERLREEFVSVVAHDLRAPITIIAGYAGLLEKMTPDTHGSAQEHRAIGNILSSAKRLERMVTDLLDASRIEARRLALEKQEIDLVQLVRDTIERSGELTVGHVIELEVEGIIPLVNADPGRIEQGLINLLSNAAKYSYPNTPIDVRIKLYPGEVQVSVTDQGPGIPAEVQEKLFTRFYRAEIGGTAAGLGLGLYITKGLVEAHGGRIWLTSEEGKLTTFYFTLPLK